MTIARGLALLTLVLVALAAVIRAQTGPRAALPAAPGPVVLVLTETPLDRWVAAETPRAVLPARAGKGSWDFIATVAAGSRSPVAPDAPRLGPVLRAAGVTTIAIGATAARLLECSAQTALLTPLPPRCLVAVSESAPSALPATPYTRVVVGLPQSRRFVPLALQTAPPLPPALLTSPSTGFRPGLVAATDLAQTLAALCGVTAAKIGAGRALVLGAGAPRELEPRQAALETQSRTQRFLVYLPWALTALLLLAAWRRWPALTRFCATLPLGLLLAPLVTAAWPCYLIAAALALGVAVWGQARERAVGAALLAVIVANFLLPLELLYRTPLSFGAAEAARFYGIGNEVGGLVIGATVLAVGGDALAFALLGVATTLLLGAPTLGANGGCFLAMGLTTALGVVVRVPAARRRLVGVALLALIVALVGGGALWDSRRGGARTHLGEAAVAGQQRGIGALGELAGRKLAMNVHLTTTSPWALLAFAQVGILLWQRRRGIGVTTTLGGALLVWLLNDAGIVAAATCLLIGNAPTSDPPDRDVSPAHRPPPP